MTPLTARQPPWNQPQPTVPTWLVVAEDPRWHVGIRRFVPEMFKDGRPVDVQPCQPAAVIESTRRLPRSVIFWDLAGDRLATWCESIAKTSLAAPTALQLAATTCLSPREQAVVSELGVAAVIRQIEQLPKLTAMVRAYFA